MKTVRALLLKLAVVIALFLCAQIAKATPYASGITNLGTGGGNGTIQFVLNEAGADVKVVFEDGTTNAMGVLPKGATNFALAAHTSFSIYVTKLGTGTPTLISSDTNQFSIWNSPRGVDVNKNPRVGHLFGRTYVGNSAVGGTAPNAKGIGLYALNADLTDSPLAHGTNAWGGGVFATSGGSGPWRIRLAPDGTLLVGDFSTTNASLRQYAADLNSSNLVLGTVGQVAAANAGIHGDFFGTALMTGSIATGDLVLWTADSGMGVPAATATLGPNTAVGSFNCLFRYDIGAGPLPWNNPPNYAYTVGLDSIAELRVEMDLGTDGKIIAGFGRANLSNGNIQILGPMGTNILYNSLHDGADLFNGIKGNNSQVGTYAGVRVSPDGRYLASVDINNAITIATMTNGIPDESSIFGIPNTPTTGNSRGMCWDAANNLYVCSSGQGLLRVYSLGLSTTAVTTNDYTGTNGSFQISFPPINASVAVTTALASQNYINNLTPGVPIPGIFTVSLNTNFLSSPVSVGFALSGSAVYGTNYTMNTNNTLNGVTITSSNVTFPAGTFPMGNWSQDIQIIPTATPVIGPTLTATLRVLGGTNYAAVSPLSGNVSIANTGPQLLILSAAATGATMNRGIPGDNAQFVITRWGDTNTAAYTVTNFTYRGTAVFPTDYTAKAQNKAGVPVDGTPGIVVNPGNVAIPSMIGNPVAHTDLTVRPTNVTVTINLTNAVTGITNNSQEGTVYTVSNIVVTLTELDNTTGPEPVLWSNPMTNAADSVNWTLTFASTNLGTNTQLPVVIPNYDQNNLPASINGGGSNNFSVLFGNPVANDGVPQSPVMAANGWTNALRMTVNKDFSFPAPAGVNVYPQGVTFAGNYALRFQMYLSIYSFAIDNSLPGTFPNEFAEFGINHTGTNCNWRPTNPVTPATGGSGMTNSDGIWFAINAGAGSITPADYDGFSGQPLPNNGPIERVSNTSASQAGVFKHPPFVSQDTTASRAGGSPVNKWVDVSVEVIQQTNINVFIDRSLVLSSFNNTNVWTNGTIMLGYLDAINNVSDSSAFVYYSNVRVVAISPNITAQPLSQIVTQGATVSFTTSANLGTAPVTNKWYTGVTTPVTLLQTDTNNSSSLTSTLTLPSVTTGKATNYFAVVSDSSGSVTSLLATLEVVPPPPNVITNFGGIARFTVTAVGPAAPTSYQWKTNGVNLVNGSHYAGVTTNVLIITNVQAADAITYSVAVGNAAGVVTNSATLTLVNAPSSAVVSPASQTVLWGSNATFTVSVSGDAPFTYRWKKGGVNLSNGGNVSGATNASLTLSNITSADAANYTVGITNIVGSTASSTGILAVLIPAPTFSTVSLVGTNVVLSFSSTNAYDTTNAFTLQSSAIVQGPYTNTPATFTISGGGFEVTAPQSGTNVFYRLLHNN